MIEEQYNHIRLRRQWYLGKTAPKITIDWKSIQITNEYTLYFHKDQKVSLNSNKGMKTVVIGIAIDIDNIGSASKFSSTDNANSFNSINNTVKKLGGSYVVIASSEQNIRIYNDPSGMMGVYFADGQAASSPTLLSPLIENDKILKDFTFGPGNDWYTGSATPYTGVKKLIPNCALDLTSNSFTRFWPKYEDLNPGGEKPELILDKITYLLRAMMTGVASQGKVLCSITGGQDSRVVLAASKNHWKNFSFFTLRGDWIQQGDIHYASMIAHKAKLAHQFYDIIPNEKWLDELYNEIGANESIGTRRSIASTCLRLAGQDTIHVNGNLGALCKSYYWHNKHPKTFKADAVSRDFTKPGKITMHGIAEWSKTLTHVTDPATLYNLFYLEQRAGRWISAGENCSRLFYESYTPFNHRDFFSLVSSLPLDMQYGGNILKELVRRMAPELSTIPYCKARRNWSKYIPEKIKQRIRKFVKK